MKTLKHIYQALGCEHVNTYIQSGNVIFQSPTTIEALASSITNAIKEQLGYMVSVLIRDIAYFKQIVANNPFKQHDPNALYVTIFNKPIDKVLAVTQASTQLGSDKFMVQHDVVYVYCQNGYGRTKLNNNFFEAKTKTWATTRSWRTIHKLIELGATNQVAREK